MNISTTTIESVAVVRIEGNLDTNTSTDAQESLNQLIDAGLPSCWSTLLGGELLVNFTDTSSVAPDCAFFLRRQRSSVVLAATCVSRI